MHVCAFMHVCACMCVCVYVADVIHVTPFSPVFASMTDHKPVDGALAKALQDIAIQKEGIVAVPANKAKPDRAINEALTLKAIGAGKTDLKHTETKEAVVDLKALQADSDAEKARKIAANTFGGSDIKAGMPNIMKEIQGQGGIIAVPADRAPKDNVSLSHTKTLMEIDALKGMRTATLAHTRYAYAGTSASHVCISSHAPSILQARPSTHRAPTTRLRTRR